jgi:hypothetical protein
MSTTELMKSDPAPMARKARSLKEFAKQTMIGFISLWMVAGPLLEFNYRMGVYERSLLTNFADPLVQAAALFVGLLHAVICCFVARRRPLVFALVALALPLAGHPGLTTLPDAFGYGIGCVLAGLMFAGANWLATRLYDRIVTAG